MNEDLAEAIVLAHDFGHTPFRHAGEEMLHAIMLPESEEIKNSPFINAKINDIKSRFNRESKDNAVYLNQAFGFKHNLQSVRVAAVLEDSYRDNQGKNIGLNLTNFTLYGMMIHSSLTYKGDIKIKPDYHLQFRQEQIIKEDCGRENFAWSFEAYIVAIANEFSQWHHDLEDALRGGALPLDKICSIVEEIFGRHLTKEDKKTLKEIKGRYSKYNKDRKYLADLSHIVVNTLVKDLVEASGIRFKAIEEVLATQGITTAEQLFFEYDSLNLLYPADKVICNSEDMKVGNFKKIITKAVHHSRNVERMNAKGKYIIKKLFAAYCTNPQQLPDGPILHLLVDAKVPGYTSLDKQKKRDLVQLELILRKS